MVSLEAVNTTASLVIDVEAIVVPKLLVVEYQQ
jgi:hypothetical protein